MQPLTPNDLVDIAQYKRERAAFRASIIEMKKRRRVQVGELVALVFENRDTVRFQVQEMMRAGRIVDDERVGEELDAYNRLIPGSNALSATLLIEVTDRARLHATLDRFIGIDRGGTTFLVFGASRPSTRAAAARRTASALCTTSHSGSRSPRRPRSQAAMARPPSR